MFKARIIGLVTAFATLGCSPAPNPPSAASTPVRGAPIDAPASTVDRPPLGGPSANGLRVAPSDPAERAKMAVDAPKPVDKDGFTSVSFSELSDFVYEADMNGKLSPESKLPEEIAKLDKAQVAVSGFLMPIEFKGDKVSTIILVRNQLLCCFGEEPKLNEWIFINVNPPVEPVVDVPVTMYGTFYASPDREEGQVISLYRMEATAMEALQ